MKIQNHAGVKELLKVRNRQDASRNCEVRTFENPFLHKARRTLAKMIKIHFFQNSGNWPETYDNLGSVYSRGKWLTLSKNQCCGRQTFSPAPWTPPALQSQWKTAAKQSLEVATGFELPKSSILREMSYLTCLTIPRKSLSQDLSSLTWELAQCQQACPLGLCWNTHS